MCLIPGGRVCDITLSDGKVTHIGASESGRYRSANAVIMFVLPAGIDMHVHMRDGLQARKEDWQTGTKSALAGGVTVVVDQPNTIPSNYHRKYSTGQRAQSGRKRQIILPLCH